MYLEKNSNLILKKFSMSNSQKGLYGSMYRMRIDLKLKV